jgi:hypothetical protein
VRPYTMHTCCRKPAFAVPPPPYPPFVTHTLIRMRSFLLGFVLPGTGMPGDNGMGGVGSEKNVWPELVGKDKEEAKTFLEQSTGKTVHLVESGMMMTMDFSMDRIRVFYDRATGKVAQAPRVG